jgi:hypothetical protein
MYYSIFILIAFVAFAARPAYAETLLFVDDHDILYRTGTKKVVHSLEKFKSNPVITPDNPERPWEKSIQWVSVYRDPQTAKMQLWYQAYSGKGAEDKRFKSVVAYAESDDGITWIKPKLKLFPYKTRGFDVNETNIVMIGAQNGYGDRYANSVVVNPDETDPDKKYKMAYYDWDSGDGEDGAPGLCVAFSPDGIHWAKQGGVLVRTTFGAKTLQPPYEDEDVYYHLKNPDGREWRLWRYPSSLSDAVDVLWDSKLKRYVIYGKMWIGGPDGGINWKHGMGRSESEDFIHWSPPQLVKYPDEHDPANLEFHTSPVFIHRGIYLSLNQLYTRENATIDNELMFSRDGLRWDRTFARQPLIVRGGKKSFDASFLLTNGNPIEMGDEVWFYYGGNRGIVRFPNPDEKDAPPRASKYASGIGFAKMKRDRFIGIAPDPRTSYRNWNPNAPQKKPEPPANTIGQLTLKPRELHGVKTITLNADASKGAVRLEVLNEDGFRLHGFTKDDAVPLTTDHLSHEASWMDKKLHELPPGKYMLRIHLVNAELFAMSLNREVSAQ